MNDKSATSPESNDKTPSSSLTVVVVEDSILMRAHIVASLSAIKGMGAIRQAGDVPSGLQLLETVKPDVLILEIQLPGLTGLQLLKAVRKTDPAMVIIMLTHHDQPRLRKRCAQLGANYFFSKSTEFERVAEVCRDLAERRAQRPGS
jgi:DNA-binding NarL/FixJ family response regulator